MGEESARQAYAKATQVHGAVLNIATSYLTARIAPPLGALPLGANEQSRVLDGAPAAPRDGSTGVIAYPTLEDLFGSMDYCPCDECRSILSPAAYLVDLLHFIDRPSPQAGFRNPQDVLFERRPDLQYLALTCENTNVPLPYIDLVNETLEYFVAYTSLADYQGHDTDGSVSSDELMANPQFVNDAAYESLKGRYFPLPLPFHRPLELLRLHFQKLGVKLQDVILALQPSDAIIPSWWNILIEEIGFSRQEYTLLTNGSVKLPDLYGYPWNLSDDDVIAQLSSVQNFSRRMGISYEDLISILQTRFINPNAVLIPRLRHLGVPFKTLHDLKGGSLSEDAFKALLPADLDARKYGGKDVKDFQAVVNWVKNDANYNRIKRLIVIDVPVDATDPNSAASLELCFCDPDLAARKLHPIDFVRLIRFIRLWRKLALTIAQTDDIITALYPPEDLPIGGDDAKDLKLLDSGFEVLLKRIGFLLQVMRRLNLSADRDLAPLLACWAPIGTAGEQSLYAKMFLAPTVLSQDPAFADDGYGNILQDNTQFVPAHAPALRAAFGLRDAEFTLITTALGFDASTPLTLGNISAIYRRGWLVRTLRLSVVEFLLLTRFTGLDPFTPLDPATTEPSEPPVIRLIRLLQALSAASLKPVQALYLIWNEDISGKSAPADSVVTGLARTLRADFAAVESQFTLVDDPNGNIAKSMMGLVYGTAATDFFFGLLNNTLKTTVTYSNPVGQPTLAQPILDAASGRLSYDDLRKQLIYTGVLDATTLGTIHAAVTAYGNDQSLQTALDALSNANHKLVDPFFTTYPELLTLYIFELLNNTLTTSVAYANSQPTLAQPILDAAAGRLSYDDLRKQLIYTGVLDATTLAAIHAAVTANGNDQSLQTALDALSNANHKLVDPFFTTYPELLPLYTGYVASKDPLQARCDGAPGKPPEGPQAEAQAGAGAGRRHGGRGDRPELRLGAAAGCHRSPGRQERAGRDQRPDRARDAGALGAILPHEQLGRRPRSERRRRCDAGLCAGRSQSPAHGPGRRADRRHLERLRRCPAGRLL